MPSKKVVQEVFSQVSKKYDFFLNLITAGGIKKWQEELLKNTPYEGNRLDVGTGTGEVLLRSQNKGLRVGIDLSMEMLRLAKGKCKRCKFLLADAENMPFKDESFGSITLSLVYRHLIDRKAFLKEARRVLQKGGEVCMLDINRFSLTPFLVFFMKYLIRPLGVWLFGSEKWEFFVHSLENSLSLEGVKKELRSAGFEVKCEKRMLFGLIYIVCAQKV